MKKIFLFKESAKVQKILNDYYKPLLAALKVVKPDADTLAADDPETELFSQLHDVFALLKCGQISIEWFNADKSDARYLGLIIKEDLESL